MGYKEILFSKNGIATYTLARELLKYNVGDKIPTVSELSETFDLARGTVQSAIKCLQQSDAVRIESKGHVGSYLVKKNTTVLLEFAGISSIVGVMPLPYSKRYEGLASGLLVTMENHYNIPASMAFMRGAKNRISMLISNRYDFAIVSRTAAEEMIREYDNILVVMSFGPYSYLSEHVIIFKNDKFTSIKDGMRIGIDYDSLDQRYLTEKVCEGKNVEYVSVDYSRVLERVLNGDVDAAVWNKDEIIDKYIKVNYKELKGYGTTANEAVMVVSKDESELVPLLRNIIDPTTVVNIQKLVLEGKIIPSY
ncbi:MAG: transporter substrate-binding domain-containing protein [Erysipelotrichaceae bacterium]|nr:transporter substrate-binding domain-containing protein [Erysipelotrichaceae bacterium]